jgi:hypothetical protein
MPLKRAVKKPRNYKANEATFINIDALKKWMAKIERRLRLIERRM